MVSANIENFPGYKDVADFSGRGDRRHLSEHFDGLYSKMGDT
jgi:hypothetical protein